MLDLSPAYDDTEVIDDPDEEPMPVIGRVATAELTMQVLVMSRWHRRTPDLAETACGVPIPTQFAPIRREVLTMVDPPLCDQCFTDFERIKARRSDEDAALRDELEDRKRAAEAEQRRTARAKRNTGER